MRFLSKIQARYRQVVANNHTTNGQRATRQRWCISYYDAEKKHSMVLNEKDEFSEHPLSMKMFDSLAAVKTAALRLQDKMPNRKIEIKTVSFGKI